MHLMLHAIPHYSYSLNKIQFPFPLPLKDNIKCFQYLALLIHMNLFHYVLYTNVAKS